MKDNNNSDNRQIYMGEKNNYNERIEGNYIQGNVYYITNSSDKQEQTSEKQLEHRSFEKEKSAIEEVELISSKGIDYTKLRDLLTASKWQEADRETAKVIRLASGKKEGNWLSAEDIQKIPCTELHTIDRLWLHSSNGRFGLSVQRHIFEEEGKKFGKLGEHLGWKKRNIDWIKASEVKWEIDAQYGHLPIGGGVVSQQLGEWLWGLEEATNKFSIITSSNSNYFSLMQKLLICESNNIKNIKIKNNLELSMKDIFICHASEDKPTVVEPLVTALEQANISYWYDKAEIQWGDSITQKVNEGLKISRFVIVVLSPAFLNKNFPQHELHSVLNTEIYSKEVKVLPLLAASNKEEKEGILRSLPILNSKAYETWDGNTDKIIKALLGRLKLR
jgi:hypothetical protein